MGWTYAFWALSALAFIGVFAVDRLALKRKIGHRSAIGALALKGLVVLAFTGWMAYFSLVPTQGWEDLTSLAGILVLSIPALIAALVLDVLAALKLRAAKG
jgi:hypothetical protein